MIPKWQSSYVFFEIPLCNRETEPHSYTKAGALGKRHMRSERAHLLVLPHYIMSTGFNMYTSMDYELILRCHYNQYIVNSREKDCEPGNSNLKNRQSSDPNYQYRSLPQAENSQSQSHQHEEDTYREQFADSAEQNHVPGE